MTSYITLLSKIEQFCNAHIQIKKYGGEFREQMPNFSTKDEKYPVVFVEPTSDLEDINTNQFSINIYCVDIIQKDRANLNTILSDCQLILKDLYTYYSQDNDVALDVVGTANMSPLNNFDSDYVAGWVMSITFEVAGYCWENIPMNPITPSPVTCPEGLVINSTESYSASVESGGTLTLPDVHLVVIDQNKNVLSDQYYPSVEDQVIEVTIPPCEDVNYRIADTANNTLYSGTIPSGGSLDQTINNTFVSNSNDTYTASVLAQGSLELPDVTFSVENSLENVVWSATIPSMNAAIGSAPDATLNIKKFNDGTITNLTLPSGTANNYSVADNALTVNNANGFSIHATDPLNIRLHNQSGSDITPQSVVYQGNANHVTITVNTASFVPVGATLLKTGQTTSYATGDDGATQRGRLTNFTTLPSNNPFGNTNRFTSKTGTQVYTNSVAYDWSTYNNNTVLAYYFGDANTRPWATQLTQYTGSTIDGLTGWNLFNINEAMNIMNFSFPGGFLYNYAPFNLTRRYMFVSTNQTGTNAISTETAGPNPFTTVQKVSSLWGIWVRVCTVNGTTIS